MPPKISAFLEFLIATNSLPVCSVGLPVRWQLLDKCHMRAWETPLQHPLESLSNSAAKSRRSCHQVLHNANLNPLYFIQSFSYSERRELVSAAAADLSITCAVCRLQLGRITRCYKYRTGWQVCSGTPSFAHYQCIL